MRQSGTSLGTGQQKQDEESQQWEAGERGLRKHSDTTSDLGWVSSALDEGFIFSEERRAEEMKRKKKGFGGGKMDERKEDKFN